MIVVDASAVLELLLRTPRELAVATRVFQSGETLHAPHLIDLEVAQVLRRYALSGQVSAARCDEALQDWGLFRVHRHPHEPLLSRIWELRDNITAYDAAYVALAEAIDAPLLTSDMGIASAPGHAARVEVF